MSVIAIPTFLTVKIYYVVVAFQKVLITKISVIVV